MVVFCFDFDFDFCFSCSFISKSRKQQTPHILLHDAAERYEAGARILPGRGTDTETAIDADTTEERCVSDA
jgi:hypothetical protein